MIKLIHMRIKTYSGQCKANACINPFKLLLNKIIKIHADNKACNENKTC